MEIRERFESDNATAQIGEEQEYAPWERAGHCTSALLRRRLDSSQRPGLRWQRSLESGSF